MELLKLVRKIIPIAKDAGAAILAIYHADQIMVKQKADQSPLTLADQRANEIICQALVALPEEFPIISEENKSIPYETRKDFEYHWLVDPLDGTKEFIKKNGEFTVNIALIHQQQVILGVVYTPCSDELYWAVKGEGAFLLKDGQEKQLAASNFKMKDADLNIVCSRSHLNESTSNFIAQFTNPNLVATGSSLKFLIIADGKAHIYPRLAPTMEWDTGAAQIILEEAGGSVIDQVTQQPLRYNKENLLNPHFIAFAKRSPQN